MADLLVGRGYNVVRNGVVAEVVFDVLGPLAVGDVVRRIQVFWRTRTGNTIFVAATVGSSAQAGIEGFGAGRPVIQVTNQLFTIPPGDVNSWATQTLTETRGWFVWNVGVPVETGSQFVHFGWRADDAGEFADFSASVEVWRLGKGRGQSETS